MKKIILSVAVSLDGFIEGSMGEYDWCPPPSTQEMNAFMNRIDTIFLGRKSFESFESRLFPEKEIVVFSNSLATLKDVKIIGRNFVEEVESIKKQDGKDIWLYGGANLTTSFINNGLVDEIWLGLVPILLGSGKPLFQGITQRNNFTVIKTTNNDGYLSIYLKIVDTKSSK